MVFATTLITLLMSLNYEKYISNNEKIREEGCGPSRRPLYVGVVSSNLNRAMNIHNTWAKGMMNNGSIEYYVNVNAGEFGQNRKLPIVEVPLTHNLLLKKTFYTYKHMYSKYVDCYDWFIRADDDIYLRIPEILKFIAERNPSELHYIGQQGAGLPKELKFLKLKKSDRYCMGGSGVIISRELLKKIGPYLDTCLENHVYYHDDVEFGRCVIRNLGIQCAPGHMVGTYSDIHLYYKFSEQVPP